MSSRLSKAWAEIAEALEELEGRTDEFGRMRRIQICNDVADGFYRLSEELKAAGRHEAANQAHRNANEFWSRVVEDCTDLETAKGSRST
jgi:hypothetical protein